MHDFDPFERRLGAALRSDADEHSVRSRRRRSPAPRSTASGGPPVCAGPPLVPPDGSAGAAASRSSRRPRCCSSVGRWRWAPASCGCRRSSRPRLPRRSPWSPPHLRPRPRRRAIARHADRNPDAERLRVAIADPCQPQPDMDEGRPSMRSRRVSRGSAIASCSSTRSRARSAPPPMARTGRPCNPATPTRATSTCSKGPSRAGRTAPSGGGTRRIMKVLTSRAHRRSPLGTSCRSSIRPRRPLRRRRSRAGSSRSASDPRASSPRSTPTSTGTDGSPRSSVSGRITIGPVT